MWKSKNCSSRQDFFCKNRNTLRHFFKYLFKGIYAYGFWSEYPIYQNVILLYWLNKVWRTQCWFWSKFPLCDNTLMWLTQKSPLECISNIFCLDLTLETLGGFLLRLCWFIQVRKLASRYVFSVPTPWEIWLL